MVQQYPEALPQRVPQPQTKGGDYNGTGIRALKTALGLSVSMLSAEHIFSATLSSPWTTGKLATSVADQTAFWRLFWEAAIASIVFAIIVGVILKDPAALAASLIGTVVILIWLYFDYSRALSGDLYKT